MFSQNPYLKARNSLLYAWLVILGGFLLGLLFPVVITIYVANTTPASPSLFFDLWLIIAVSFAVSNQLSALLFLVRRGIGVFGSVVRWIFSAIFCFVLFTMTQGVVQSCLLQNPNVFRIVLVVLWFALVIAEPIISIFRIKKLNEQYQLSLPHKEVALTEQADRKKRRFNNDRTPKHKKDSDSSDDSFFYYYDYYDDDAYEKRQREEEEWREEEDRIYREEDDYYNYYQPTYSDDD